MKIFPILLILLIVCLIAGCQAPNLDPPAAPETSHEPTETTAPSPDAIHAFEKAGPTGAGVGAGKGQPASSRGGELTGGLKLVNAPVAIALEIYGSLTGKQLEVSSAVQNSAARVNVDSKKIIAKKEGIRLLEKALREQAGVTITPLDDTRLSVTASNP